jgi:pyruvate/2-oxoacid:ferredoxin oxidoreductase beta subunit
MIAMSYGNVYVARSPWAPTTMQTIKAFHEAEAYPGPSLIIAYSHLHRPRLRPASRRCRSRTSR